MIRQKRARKSKQDSTYKSLLEKKVASLLPQHVSNKYETHRITYLVEHTYTPDFTINDKLFIEVKGYFRPEDRAKHLYIKEQHPEIEIVFIFADAKTKINKASKTTYADWCCKYGFRFTDVKSGIPSAWTKE